MSYPYWKKNWVLLVVTS